MLITSLVSVLPQSFAQTESKAYKGVIAIALSGVIWKNDHADRKHVMSGTINVDYLFSESAKTIIFSISDDKSSKLVIDSKEFQIPAGISVQATSQSMIIEFEDSEYSFRSKLFFPERLPTVSETDRVAAIKPSYIALETDKEIFKTFPPFAIIDAQVKVLDIQVENTPNLEELRQYALNDINKNRMKPGPKVRCFTSFNGEEICSPIVEISPITYSLKCDKDMHCESVKNQQSISGGGEVSPVQLSNNGAAQELAEDMLREKYLSFWLSNGEKPYMTYSRLGGMGEPDTSIAWNYYPEESVKECTFWLSHCPKLDPEQAIDKLINLLTNVIETDGSWTNRENVLDKYHSHVSIGIAYDDYHVILVLTFENNYATYSRPPTLDEENQVHVRSEISEGKLSSFSIYRDTLPSSKDYDRHKEDSYDYGDLVAMVVEPAGDGYYYDEPDDYRLIEASSWNVNNDRVDVMFDMDRVIRSSGGVYTVTMWLEDTEGELFPGSSFSFIVPKE